MICRRTGSCRPGADVPPDILTAAGRRPRLRPIAVHRALRFLLLPRQRGGQVIEMVHDYNRHKYQFL